MNSTSLRRNISGRALTSQSETRCGTSETGGGACADAEPIASVTTKTQIVRMQASIWNASSRRPGSDCRVVGNTEVTHSQASSVRIVGHSAATDRTGISGTLAEQVRTTCPPENTDATVPDQPYTVILFSLHSTAGEPSSGPSNAIK